MKSAEEEQTRTNKELPWLGCISLLNPSVPRTGLSKLPWYFHCHSEATQQLPWAFIGSGAPEMPDAFLWNIIRVKDRNVWFLHCYRLTVKAINLLVINNSYTFTGVGIGNKILKTHKMVRKRVFLWVRQIKYRPTFLYSSNTCCQAPFLICAMLLMLLLENTFFPKPGMNTQQVPDTQ